ncbi:hypothetical protein PybrP1_012896 [[Pythium] brassicae (nom. inval.)]|nr:hypothetical protein PybrP1_012896 [[Pythium] brassicae (nom. inval.)]
MVPSSSRVLLALVLLCGAAAEQATARSLASISITVKSHHEHTRAAPVCAPKDCKVKPDDANVCGSDGKVYYNECLFQNAQCRNAALAKVADWNGHACPTTCTQHISCKEIGKFLCGSDGNVYFGYCRLYSAQCVDPALQEIECPQGLIQIPPRRQ